MSAITQRAVFVTRETDYESLIARHATRGQARFFLESRGQRIEAVEAQHTRFHAVLARARGAVPAGWRQALVGRAELDRFLFGPDDVVVAVGQDGLVANVAKYLDGQPVIGIDPAPDLNNGVLVRNPVERLARLLPASLAGDVALERRTMVQAILDGGERLFALNEIFVGHRSHQTARYRIEAEQDAGEEQASSGLIVASGTGATGWARSIAEATHLGLPLGPEEPAVGYWVREPFPGRGEAARMRAGKLAAPLRVTSRMNEGGVVFADGIEQDFLDFGWGRQVSLAPAPRRLHLVVG